MLPRHHAQEAIAPAQARSLPAQVRYRLGQNINTHRHYMSVVVVTSGFTRITDTDRRWTH